MILVDELIGMSEGSLDGGSLPLANAHVIGGHKNRNSDWAL